jgi:hypothetical protein
MTTSPWPHDLPLLDSRFPLALDRPFSLRQALDAGLSVHRVRRLEEQSLIRRLLKGVYVAAQAVDTPRLRAAALALVVPHTAVVTDWSACWYWTGIDAPGDHLVVPPLSVAHRHPHTRLRNGLTRGGSRRFLPSDVVRREGITVTSPLRTAWDLGRLQHRDRAIGGIDALAGLPDFPLGEFLEGVERFAGLRGVVRLRGLAPLVDPRSESPGESTLRLRWLDLRTLPPPTPQVPILVDGVEVYRIDLGVPELRYGCEYDGVAFHLDRSLDVARRTDLRRRFGWTVEGVGRDQLFGPTRDIEERLVRGIEQARRALGSPTYFV